MNQLSLGLGILVAVIIVIGAIVGTIVFVRASYGKATIVALREDNADLRASLADADREIAKLKLKEAELSASVDNLKSDNVRLTELVTNAAKVNQLIIQAEKQHKEIMRAFTSLINAFESGAAHE